MCRYLISFLFLFISILSSPVWYPIALVTPPPTWSLLDTTNPGLGAIALYNNSVYGMFPTTIKYFYKCDENSERAIWSAENIREHVNEWHVNVTSKECCIVKKKHKRIILKNY